MTDTPAREPDTAAEHAKAWTTAGDVRIPGDPGPVAYAEVYDEHGLAGYVWMTRSLQGRPRAGIVVLSTTRRDPSTALQGDVGLTATAMILDGRYDADAWIDDLAATYGLPPGTPGAVSIGERRYAASVTAIRNLAR